MKIFEAVRTIQTRETVRVIVESYHDARQKFENDTEDVVVISETDTTTKCATSRRWIQAKPIPMTSDQATIAGRGCDERADCLGE